MDDGKSPVGQRLLALRAAGPARSGSITGRSCHRASERDRATTMYLLRVVTRGRDDSVRAGNNPESMEDMLATDRMRTWPRLRAVIDRSTSRWASASCADIRRCSGGPSAGNWNSGHVALNDKGPSCWSRWAAEQIGGPSPRRPLDRQYTFHWRGQNRTSPDGKRGQRDHQHQARGITIHLFVRDEAGRCRNGAFHLLRARHLPLTSRQ